MFYSQFILAKKGPLGTIWIAAHLERKLRKNQVADTDIGDSVDSILFPDVPIALRLSSHLLLGVVRIYSRKVNYLFDDCSEALLKIKQAFRSTAVDLPPEQSKAPYHSITLPETFDLDDFELPDNDIFQGNYVDHHVSTREQITLQDNVTGIYSTSQFGLDERFGDGDTSQVGLDLEEDILLGKANVSETDPQASTEPAFCMETDANDDEMDVPAQDMPVNGTRNKNEGLTTTSETIEYAQAPSTPLLIGEPNLSSAQESLACDDNLESEYQITKLGVEGTRKASSKMNHQDGDDVADLSSGAHLNHGTDVCMVDKENGHPGHFQSTETIESIPTNGIDGRQEDCSVKVERVINGDGKQSMPTKDQMHGEYVDSEDGRLHQTDEGKVCNEIGLSHSQNEAANALEFPVASELEDVACQVHRDPGNPETCNNQIDSEQAPSNSVPVLRACNSQITHPEENQILEPMYNGQIQADDGMIDEHLDRAITTANQLENQNASETSELPEPEKLLSMPQPHSDKAKELLVESTEKEDGGEVDKSHDNNRLSGKKRNLPDSSLTTPGLNSGESFELTRSKNTVDLIPDDDDLLSSILVGRKSSVLKMKPTPAPDEVSRKRSRPASRSSAVKRKVPMDDSMVLHGDTIRQQLINTEDIRRRRKKAPCTQIEVLLIQRQFLEEELFDEPLLTGVSEEVTCLHNKTFDFSNVRISENVDTNAPTELSKDKEFSSSPNAFQYTDMEVSTQPVVRGDVARVDQTSTQNENHHEIDEAPGSSIACNLENINSYGKKFDQETVDHEALPCGSEMGTNENAELADAADTSVVLRGDTSQAEPLCEHISPLPTDSLTQSALLNQNTDTDTSLMMDGLARQSYTANPEIGNDSDTSHIGKGVDDVGSVNNYFENIEKVETESRADAGILSEETTTGQTGEPGTDAQVNIEQADAYLGNVTGGCVDQNLLDIDQAQEHNGGDKLGVGNNDDDPSIRSLHDDREQIPTNSCDEETRFDVSCSAALDGNVEIASLADSGRPLFDQDRNIDVECTSFNYLDEGFQDFEFANDTDFLNFDEGDAEEEDDDEMPSAEDTRLLVNSGWSGRTRAVGKYLQTLFDDQVGHGRKALSVDNLLSGKTCKEAARMFFETLVLKTKDYIQVEQEKPFNNIVIKPTTKLMKSEF